MIFMCKVRVILLLISAAHLCCSKSTGRAGWPQKVSYTVRGDYYLEDDIMMTEEQVSDIMNRKMRDKDHFWPRNKDNVMEIKYAWDLEPTGSYKKEEYLGGVKNWMENTCLVFTETPIPDDAANAPTYLLLTAYKKGGCTSFVGKAFSKGAQEVNLNTGCGVPTATHELGHAIGFQHEQCRTDRDDYVRVMVDHLTVPFPEANFGKRANTANFDIPYDYSSIMHYGYYVSRRKGVDWQNTIEPLDPRFHFVLNRDDLSFMDIKLVNIAYKCIDDWKAKCGSDPCKNGGYIKDTSGSCKCVCPAGTKGDNCETLEMSYNDAVLKRYTPRSRKITTPTTISSLSYKPDYHSTWIIAPKCKRAVVTFTSFNFDGQRHSSDNSCKIEHLELQLGEIGKGNFFCGKDIKTGQRFVSEKSTIRMHLYFTGISEGYSADVTFEDIPKCS